MKLSFYQKFRPCGLLVLLLVVSLAFCGCNRTAVGGATTDVNNRSLYAYIRSIDPTSGTIMVDELEQVSFNDRERVDTLSLADNADFINGAYLYNESVDEQMYMLAKDCRINLYAGNSNYRPDNNDDYALDSTDYTDMDNNVNENALDNNANANGNITDNNLNNTAVNNGKTDIKGTDSINNTDNLNDNDNVNGTDNINGINNDPVNENDNIKGTNNINGDDNINNGNDTVDINGKINANDNNNGLLNMTYGDIDYTKLNDRIGLAANTPFIIRIYNGEVIEISECQYYRK